MSERAEWPGIRGAWDALPAPLKLLASAVALSWLTGWTPAEAYRVLAGGAPPVAVECPSCPECPAPVVVPETDSDGGEA